MSMTEWASGVAFDSITGDPPTVDPDFPPEETPAHFTSRGSVVHATAWIAQGADPRGTAILCPQLFGGDRLESLIIPMMTSGINVITYHPRGMWDDRNVLTLRGAVEDAFACVEFVRATADGTVKTLSGLAWRTDPARVVLMGLSGGGGNASLAVCAGDPMVDSAIAIAPNSLKFEDPEQAEELGDLYDAVKALSAGRIDPDSLFGDMTVEEFDQLSPLSLVPSLIEKNILLVGAQFDLISPIESNHKRIAQAFHDAGAKRFHEVVLSSDHMFLNKRIALARVIIDWLQKECGF